MSAPLLLLVLVVSCSAYRPTFIPSRPRVSESYFSLAATESDSFSVDENNVINFAKIFASTSFGITDRSLIADNFQFSGPSVRSIEKSKYIDSLSKEISSFQRALPDFEYRSFGFTVDDEDPNTVWFKTKPQGTLTGPFAYKGEVYLSKEKGNKVFFPSQQLSLTIRNNQVCFLSCSESSILWNIDVVCFYR